MVLFLKVVDPKFLNSMSSSSRSTFTNLYQGPIKGFQSFQGAVNSLLNSPDVNADVSLKLEFKFSSSIQPSGTEMSTIKNALSRNPVERLSLIVKVSY